MISFLFTLTGKLSPGLFLAVLSGAAVIFLIFWRLRLYTLSKVHGKFDLTEGEINLLTESIADKKKLLRSLPLKYQRISLLFNISQKLIELTDREDILDLVISALSELFPQAESIAFFDFNKERDTLSLARASRHDTSAIEKTGDVLDQWVLRHNLSLLIEDLTKDFRFDFNKVKVYKSRGITSLIISPLAIGHRILGLVRIESRKPLTFSLDDSRILRSICDLGAVVFEKASFFRRLEDLAIRDSLTALFIKDYFFARLSEELERAKGKTARPGVIMLDIDNFKDINDNHGHIVGDLALKNLAKILTRTASGGGNVIARFGGEEFVILIVETNKTELLVACENIRRAVEESGLSFRRKRIKFTVSLGAVLSSGDEGAAALVDKSDKLMYRAKKEGKNRVCFSS